MAFWPCFTEMHILSEIFLKKWVILLNFIDRTDANTWLPDSVTE